LQIAGVGDLAGSGSIPLSLTLSSPIEEPDEEEGWDVSETRYPCYWFWRCIPVPIILESEGTIKMFFTVITREHSGDWTILLDRPTC